MRWWQVPVARDRDDGRVGGVVAGLCRSYGFDVKTTRIAVAIATVVLPVFALLYAVAWALLPQTAAEAVPLRDVITDRRRLPLMVAIGIVLVAGSLGSFGSWFLFGGPSWGIALIAVGLLLWVMPKMSTGARSQRSVGELAPGEAQGIGSTAPWINTPPNPTVGAGTALTHASSPTPQAPPTRRRRRPIVAIGLLLAFLYVMFTAMGDALGWWNSSVLWVSVAALAIVITAILVGAIVNRGWLGIPIAVILMCVMASLLITRPNLDGGVGDRTVHPITTAAARDIDNLAAGQLTVDLTGVAGSEAVIPVNAEVGFGRLHVIAPADAVLKITTDVGAGHAMINGREIANGVRQHDSRTDMPASSTTDPRRTFVLHLRVGGGEIAVDRVGTSDNQ